MAILNREQTLNLFLSHAPALQVRLLAVSSSYSLDVSIGGGRTYRALVLARSSDYWKARVHLGRSHPELVIAYAHDTCLPCSVLSLDEGYQYEPCELPRWYSPEKRGSQRGSMVLLGQLLAGMEAGFVHLDQLPRSTRYRYLAKMRQFMRGRVGRPLVA